MVQPPSERLYHDATWLPCETLAGEKMTRTEKGDFPVNVPNKNTPAGAWNPMKKGGDKLKKKGFFHFPHYQVNRPRSGQVSIKKGKQQRKVAGVSSCEWDMARRLVWRTGKMAALNCILTVFSQKGGLKNRTIRIGKKQPDCRMLRILEWGDTSTAGQLIPMPTRKMRKQKKEAGRDSGRQSGSQMETQTDR